MLEEGVKRISKKTTSKFLLMANPRTIIIHARVLSLDQAQSVLLNK